MLRRCLWLLLILPGDSKLHHNQDLVLRNAGVWNDRIGDLPQPGSPGRIRKLIHLQWLQCIYRKFSGFRMLRSDRQVYSEYELAYRYLRLLLHLVGVTSVYRICMAMAVFYLFFMLVMLCVCSSRDPRSYVQNGFWLFKWILFIGVIIGFFFIPITNNLGFSTACIVLGMAGSFLFIFLQVSY